MAPRCVPAEALRSGITRAQAAMMHSHFRHHMNSERRTTTMGSPSNSGGVKVAIQPPPKL